MRNTATFQMLSFEKKTLATLKRENLGEMNMIGTNLFRVFFAACLILCSMSFAVDDRCDNDSNKECAGTFPDESCEPSDKIGIPDKDA